MKDNDIRFVDKKIDESWKEQAAKEKEKLQPPPSTAPTGKSSEKSPETPLSKTSPIFLNLLKSLGYQAMIHLGELPHPSSGQKETDLEAAKEAIDLLLTLKEKTGSNASVDELEIFQGILPELQLKFAAKHEV